MCNLINTHTHTHAHTRWYKSEWYSTWDKERGKPLRLRVVSHHANSGLETVHALEMYVHIKVLLANIMFSFFALLQTLELIYAHKFVQQL